MSDLVWHDFIGYVKDWSCENKKKIAKMWPQKGGWEKWAQNEIKAYVLEQNDTINITKKVSVYQTRLQADFLITNKFAESVIIEMKCQSFYNFKNYKRGLDEDVKKILTVKEEYAQHILIVMGFFFSNEQPPAAGFFTNEVLNDEIGISYAVEIP